MCKFLLTGCMEIIFAKILLQSLCNPFPYAISFPKAKFDQNLTNESGSKQRFSLLQEKAVIQAVCLSTQAVGIKLIII